MLDRDAETTAQASALTSALASAKRLLLSQGATLHEGEQLCVPLLGTTLKAERVGQHYLLLAEWDRPEASLLDLLEWVAETGDPCLQLVVHRGIPHLCSVRAALDANDVDRFHALVNQ